MKFKIKSFLFLTVTLFILITDIRCNDEPTVGDIYHTWKFKGFGNLTGATFEKALPATDDNCYKLTIHNDGKISGFSTTNSLSGQLSIDGENITSISLGGTKIYELGNGEKFLMSVKLAESYKISNNQLKLYYNQGTSFLLFDYVNL